MFPCSKLDLAVCAGASWGLEPISLPHQKQRGGRVKLCNELLMVLDTYIKRYLRRTAKARGQSDKVDKCPVCLFRRDATDC